MGAGLNSNAEKICRVANLLVRRLERLSPDSIWARRASGLRGALLRAISIIQKDPTIMMVNKLEGLVSTGFKLLEKAAGEIPDIEAILKEYE